MIQRIQNSKWVFVLISVFLAVIFWMYVRNDLDPPGSRTIYNVPVTLTGETILESQGLTITAVSDTAVDLKITAPISILNKLSNRNLSVTVNVSQCTEGEQILQYDVNWPRDVSTAEITKESQEPAAITVMVARLYSKTFEIQPVLKASIAPGYQAGQITISPETVTISGSEEAVSRVAKVEAVLEGEELNTRFSGNVPLVLLDAEGNELTDLEINMDTDTTYVTMPVYVVKEVKLTVDYTPGGGATGEDVTSAKKTEIRTKTHLLFWNVDDYAGPCGERVADRRLAAGEIPARCTRPSSPDHTSPALQGVTCLGRDSLADHSTKVVIIAILHRKADSSSGRMSAASAGRRHGDHICSPAPM